MLANYIHEINVRAATGLYILFTWILYFASWGVSIVNSIFTFLRVGETHVATQLLLTRVTGVAQRKLNYLVYLLGRYRTRFMSKYCMANCHASMPYVRGSGLPHDKLAAVPCLDKCLVSQDYSYGFVYGLLIESDWPMFSCAPE